MSESISPDTLRRYAVEVARLPEHQLNFASLTPLVTALLAEMGEMEPLVQPGTEPQRLASRERWER